MGFQLVQLWLNFTTSPVGYGDYDGVTFAYFDDSLRYLAPGV